MLRRPRRLSILLPLLVAVAVAVIPARGESIRLRPVNPPIYARSDGVGLVEPEAVACRGSALVIADSGNSRLLRFETAGENLTPAEVWTFTELPFPVQVQIDAEGSVWVLDGKAHRIGRIGSDGRFAGFVDIAAASDRGALIRAFRIGPEGDLYVLDVGSGRVRVVSKTGSPRRTISMPRELAFASDLSIGSSGTVYVLDSVGRRVFSAGKGDAALQALSGDLTEDLDFATAIHADDRGHLFLADRNGGGIVILGRDGSYQGRQSTYGWKLGMLRYPTDLCMLGGRLVVADRGNNRIQLFEILD